MLRTFILWTVLLGLPGCSLLSTSPEPVIVTNLSSVGTVEYFVLDGRVSVKAGEQQYSGGLHWDRNGHAESLLLNTPLGQGVAEIRREAGVLILTDAEGKQYLADDADRLMQRVLGVRLPMEGLVYWLSARPRPGTAHKAYLNEQGRVARLEQDGWRIEYDRYRDKNGVMLPGRLFATRADGIEFRLIADQWVSL